MKWLYVVAVALSVGTVVGGMLVGLSDNLFGMSNHADTLLTSRNIVRPSLQPKNHGKKLYPYIEGSNLKFQDKSFLLVDSGWRNLSDKADYQPSYQPEPAESSPIVVSNRYIVLRGKLRGAPAAMFLAVKTLGETNQVRGIFIQKRNNMTLELKGMVEGPNLVVREMANKNGRMVAGKTWTLTERDDGSWVGFTPQGRIIFQIDRSPVLKEFRVQNRDIHPQLVSYLFERINGNPLLVNVRNYNNRRMTREGEWLMANLEYGYIRYRVLTNFNHSWILETERSGGKGSWSSQEIIHVVWLRDGLCLFRLIDQDHQSSGKIFDLANDGIISYKKKVTGTDLMNYMNDFELGFSSVGEENGDSRVTEPCETCDQVVLTINYEVENDFRRIVSLELLPGQPSQFSDQANTRLEIGFRQTIEEYLDQGITIFREGEINRFIDSWLKRIL